MQWLRKRQDEVMSQNITAEEKARCLLPQTTMDGWFITCEYKTSLADNTVDL